MNFVDLLKYCLDIEGIEYTDDTLEDEFMKKIFKDAEIDLEDSDNNDAKNKMVDALKNNDNEELQEQVESKDTILSAAQEDIDKTKDKVDEMIMINISAGSFSVSSLSSFGGGSVINSKLKTENTIEAFVLKKKKPKNPSLAKTEDAQDAHYSAIQDYPNSSTKIDALGNFIKINKKTGQVDIAHFSGTLIQITKSGSINIHTKKDVQHIVEGNYYLEVKGDYGIKSKNINIECENKTFKSNTRKIETINNELKINKSNEEIKELSQNIDIETKEIGETTQKNDKLSVKVPLFDVKGTGKFSNGIKL